MDEAAEVNDSASVAPAVLDADAVERIFYARYGAKYDEFHAANKPVVQRELRRASWQAAIDAIRAESTQRIANLEAENAALREAVLLCVEADAR